MALIDSARTDSGARQRYRFDQSVKRELVTLIAAERQCCPFLEFGLSRVDDRLELVIRGPAEAAPILDAFVTAAPREQEKHG